jgi:hypothetical protein
MKKLMIVAIVFAIALSASYASAGNVCYDNNHKQCPCPDQSNSAYGVSATIGSMANSGGNEITVSGAKSNNSITTGNADSKVDGTIYVNSNSKSGMWTMGSQTNSAKDLELAISAYADTGTNVITVKDKNKNKPSYSKSGMFGTHHMTVSESTNSIKTGNSTSKTNGVIMVNSNVKIGCPCSEQPSCGCAR